MVPPGTGTVGLPAPPLAAAHDVGTTPNTPENMRFFTPPRRPEESLLWSRDIRFVNRLAQLMPAGRLLELDSGTCLIAPGHRAHRGARRRDRPRRAGTPSTASSRSTPRSPSRTATSWPSPRPSSSRGSPSASAWASPSRSPTGRCSTCSSTSTTASSSSRSSTSRPVRSTSGSACSARTCRACPGRSPSSSRWPSPRTARSSSTSSSSPGSSTGSRRSTRPGRHRPIGAAATRSTSRRRACSARTSRPRPSPRSVSAHGLTRRQITLECTEQMTVSDPSGLAKHVREMRKLGFGFAVDDAGAGYASFTLIAALRPSIIKIDREIDPGHRRQARGRQAGARRGVRVVRPADRRGARRGGYRDPARAHHAAFARRDLRPGLSPRQAVTRTGRARGRWPACSRAAHSPISMRLRRSGASRPAWRRPAPAPDLREDHERGTGPPGFLSGGPGLVTRQRNGGPSAFVLVRGSPYGRLTTIRPLARPDR